MSSVAWRSLTPQQRAVYLEVENRHNGSNNGFVSLSVREAAEACNISKDRSANCFRVLIERGFQSYDSKGQHVLLEQEISKER